MPIRRAGLSTLWLMLFLAAAPLVAQNIAVNIIEPPLSSRSGDVLVISADVTAANQIQSVTAVVEDRQTALAFSDGRWRGQLSLVGLAKGPHPLTVTAQDVLNDTGSDQVTFIYDNKATIEVSSPIDESVATPMIQVTASCEDDLPPCTVDIDVKTDLDQFALIEANGSIDQSVALDAYDGQMVTLVFTAVDSGGQASESVERRVYVDSSCWLESVYDVPGKIVDVHADRILYLDDTGVPVIRDRDDHTDTPIPMPAGYFVEKAYLSPRGAIFTAGVVGSNDAAVIEWQDDAPLNHGHPNGRSSLVVSGDYAIWSGTPGPFTGGLWDLFLRDLQGGTTDEVDVEMLPNNTRNDVASDGTVAFSADDSNIHLYENGTATPLTTASGMIHYRHPVTDGTNTVYARWDSEANTFAIVKHDGTTATEIAPPREAAADPREDYEVENGWIAFTTPTTTDEVHVFTIPPGGSPQQVSFFNTSSTIETLASNGEVTLLHPDTDARYFGSTTAPARRINSRLGKAYAIAGEWYVAIGRTLFRVVPAGTPTTTTMTVSGSTLQGESITFTATVSGSGVTGPVLFRDGSRIIGEEMLSGGKAVFTTSSLSAGLHFISAEYQGDGTFSCSRSAERMQLIRSRTTIAVTSTPNPSRLGTQIKFTATVTRVAGGAPPTGFVTFRSGSTDLVVRTIVNGVATYSTTTGPFKVGTHAVTVVYQGDDNNGPATSPVYEHVVLPPFGAPENLTATATDPAHILVTWNPVADVQFYELERKDSLSTYSVIAAPTDPQFTDTAVSPDHAYLYRARAVKADGTRSAYSIIDPATTFTFSRDPLVPRLHAVKAADILELQAAINAYAFVANENTFYSAGVAPGSRILFRHLRDLQRELSEIRARLQLPPLLYTEGNVIQAAQIQQLRNACK